MATQFIRIEGYGRKARGAPHRSAAGMIAEMMRDPAASAHIEIGGFEGARIVHGENPSELIRLALERSALARDRRGHKLKKTSNILFIAVVSYPLARADRAADECWTEAYEEWLELNVAWASACWRDADLCIVEHTDEDKRHLHIVIEPRLDCNQQLAIGAVHPGFGAEADAIDQTPANERKTRTFKARQRAVYCTAMRRFQDDYHRAVAGPFGLAQRSGTPRDRMSRAAALIDQRQAARALELNEQERGLIIERSNLKRREVRLMQLEVELAAERERLAAERAQLELEIGRIRPAPVADVEATAPEDDFDVGALVDDAPRPTKATRSKNDVGAELWATARARLEADSARIQLSVSSRHDTPAPAAFEPPDDD